MLTLDTLDPSTPFEAQLRRTTGPIALVSMFVAPEEAVADVLALCEADAAFMAELPGFAGARIHRGTAGSRVICQIVDWASTGHLAAAVEAAGADPAVRARSARMPAGVTLYVHIFDTADPARSRPRGTTEGNRA